MPVTSAKKKPLNKGNPMQQILQHKMDHHHRSTASGFKIPTKNSQEKDLLNETQDSIMSAVEFPT